MSGVPESDAEATGRHRRRGDLVPRISAIPALPVRSRDLAAAAVALVALVPLGCASGGRDSVPEGLTDLRVCSDAAFDEAEQACSEDQRGQPISGSAVYCSAKVGDHEGERFTGRVLYEGEMVFADNRTLPEGQGTVWVTVDLGEPLPGGEWTCELVVGSEKASARFQGTAPPPRILSVAACPTANTVPAGSIRICPEDESGKPLGPTDSVTCSTSVFGGTGKVIRADFVYLDRERGLSVRKKIPEPLVDFEAHFTREPGLLAGDYACVFFLGGEQVGERTFTVRS